MADQTTDQTPGQTPAAPSLSQIERIRENLRRLKAQNAPKEDYDKYFAIEREAGARKFSARCLGAHVLQ